MISITDGQLFLEADLFNAGQRPAVNLGLSVSRVGGDAQTPIMKKLGSPLKAQLSQYRDLEAFAQFGSDLDKETQRSLDRGRRLMEILKQPQFSPDPVYVQAALIYAGSNGYISDVPLDRVKEWERDFIKFMDTSYPQIQETIRENPRLDAVEADLKKALKQFNEQWS